MKIITVVAAVIRREGKVLLASRPASKPPLGWEFPGGKVEPGETKKAALIRECREELGVTVQPLDVYMSLKHIYPDMIVRLTLFNATIVTGMPHKLEHNDIRWITVPQIDNYEFCPADVEILDRLKAEYAGKLQSTGN